jgi:virginiamycin B lyase
VGRLDRNQQLRVFPLGIGVSDLVFGPDGNLWIAGASHAGNEIVRLSTDGRTRAFRRGISSRAVLAAITVGADGALWFVEDFGSGSGRIARMTLAGEVTEFPAIHDASGDASTDILALAGGPDGNVWFVTDFSVGTISPSGQYHWVGSLTDDQASDPSIVPGPDGNMWVVGMPEDTITRIAPSGAASQIRASGATDVLFNPDGTFWVSGFKGITRRTDSGRVVERSRDPLGETENCRYSQPRGAIAADASGQVWVAAGSSLLRVTAAPGARAGPLTDVMPNRGSFKAPHAMVRARDGTVWIATDRAFIRLVGRQEPRIVRRYHGARVIALAAGHHGTLWFTDTAGHVGRLRPGGAIRIFRRGLGTRLAGIAVDRRGEPWFVEHARHRIGHLTADADVQTFGKGITRHSSLLDIAAGPHDTMWFTDKQGRIGRITRSGHAHMFRVGPPRRHEPVAITRGPDNAMWFTDARGYVSRISSTGRIQEHRIAIEPVGILRGSDRAIWVSTVGWGTGGLGRIDMHGHHSEWFLDHTCDTSPWNITSSPRGGFLISELDGPVAVVGLQPKAAF